MNILLDTCTFLWIITDHPRLSARAREFFTDPAHTVYLSAVSAWEITVKYMLGRLALPEPPVRYIPMQRLKHQVESLVVEEEACVYLSKLPDLHRDPFDRILICQALVAGMAIMTPDELIGQYPVRTIW